MCTSAKLRIIPVAKAFIIENQKLSRRAGWCGWTAALCCCSESWEGCSLLREFSSDLLKRAEGMWRKQGKNWRRNEKEKWNRLWWARREIGTATPRNDATNKMKTAAILILRSSAIIFGYSSHFNTSFLSLFFDKILSSNFESSQIASQLLRGERQKRSAFLPLLSYPLRLSPIDLKN